LELQIHSFADIFQILMAIVIRLQSSNLLRKAQKNDISRFLCLVLELQAQSYNDKNVLFATQHFSFEEWKKLD